MYPELLIIGDKPVNIGVCSECSVVRAFTIHENSKFPDTGWWITCPVCHTYTMYYRLSQQAKLIVEGKRMEKPESRNWERSNSIRKDIIGQRELPDGRMEYLCHNEALCRPYYLAVSDEAETAY